VALRVFSQLDHNLSCVVRETFLVLNVPPERLEKRRDEINARLSLGIALGQIVSSV